MFVPLLRAVALALMSMYVHTLYRRVVYYYLAFERLLGRFRTVPQQTQCPKPPVLHIQTAPLSQPREWSSQHNNNNNDVAYNKLIFSVSSALRLRTIFAQCAPLAAKCWWIRIVSRAGLARRFILYQQEKCELCTRVGMRVGLLGVLYISWLADEFCFQRLKWFHGKSDGGLRQSWRMA